MSEIPKLTKKDFVSSQEIKWCPGCGDYAILSAAQMSMAKIGIPPHKVCVISGIGCSSRFPYYVNSYGMHSIHGRAPAVATGVKLQNPDLCVWVITGDGDGLSIGGNHLAHILRRNVDVNIILFNNEIYGLTKGQYSPTSQSGLRTKSSPYGSLDRSFNPANFALGSGCTFFARTIDTDPKHMMETFEAAQNHKGTSLVEVYQNCVIFNDKVHDKYTNRAHRDEHTIRLVEGEQMLFGKENPRAIVQEGFDLAVSGEVDRALTHDPENKSVSSLLMGLNTKTSIVPLGVLYRDKNAPVYNEDFHAQINEQKKTNNINTNNINTNNINTMSDLLMSGNTWKVQ